MGKHDDLGHRLSAFARTLPGLCVQLEGDALVDAAHRLYEEVLCATPREHLDQAHDAMVAFMRSQGLLQRYDRAA
jgi:hypothetical protein